MDKEFKYYLAIVAAILLVIVGAVWGGAMGVFGDTGAAWLGSVGTISTLAFLIYQNTSQAKEIREERQKREAHEKKQQEMWQQQRENLTFQKLQMHKQEFNNLLDELSQRFAITFFDRTKLYNNIFPNNRLQSSDVDIKLCGADIGILPKAIESHEKLLDLVNHIASERLDNLDDIKLSEQFLAETLKLRQYLHINLPNNNFFGDITCGNLNNCFVVTNIFSSLHTTSIYGETLRGLLDFVGETLDKTVRSTGFYNQPLCTFASEPSLQIGYDVNLGGIANAFSSIYHVIKTNDRDLIEDKMLSKALFHAVLTIESDLQNETESRAAEQLKSVAESLERALSKSRDPNIRERDKCINLLKSAMNELDTRFPAFDLFK